MHGDKWGPLASIFAAACCLGAAPLLGALSAVGLGFVVDDRILIPLLALSLAATIWGLDRDRPRHGSRGPELLAWAAAFVTLGGLWVSGTLVAAGLAVLVAASAWSWILVRRAGTRTGRAAEA